MDWKRNCLLNFKLYAVTDLKAADTGWMKDIEGALRGGVDVIQLRSKVLSDRSLLDLGRTVRSMTRRMRKLFILNDRPDLALALCADGVHLGQGDIPMREARKILAGRRMLIGKSTHNLKQAVAAQSEGADYIGFGPVFGTPTKPDYLPIGLDDIGFLQRKIRIPFVVIGGINRSNVESVLQAGADRVAVVRAIFGKGNTFRNATMLKRKINACLGAKSKQSAGAVEKMKEVI